MNVLARLILVTVLLMVSISTCAISGIMQDALRSTTSLIDGDVVTPLIRRDIPAPDPQIEFAPHAESSRTLKGHGFTPNESVTVSYYKGLNTPVDSYATATVIQANADGAFELALADLGAPSDNVLVARGNLSGAFSNPLLYIADPTATPSATPTLTPTPVDTATPTASPTPLTPASPTPVPSPTLNPNPVEGWFAEYFNNRDLAGLPFYTRNETPNPNPNAEGEWMCEYNPGWHPLQAEFQRKIISARWTGTFFFATDDNYQIVIQASDGVRISIDGVAYVNDWRFTSKVRRLIQNVPLTQGNHTIVIEYFHLKGPGVIGVTWRVAYPDWETRYYNTPNLSGPVIAKRNEGARSGPLQLLTDGSPAPGVNPDNFSVYWSRKVAFKDSGVYIFRGVADDGIRVFIDDQEVFRQNTTGGTAAFEFSVHLRGGHHAIQIHYYELTGWAQLDFNWEWVPPTPVPEPTPVL